MTATASPSASVPGPTDRVHFLDEQRRHRRESWRFSLLAVVGGVVTGLPLCFLVTPVLLVLALLAAHLVDLVGGGTATSDLALWVQALVADRRGAITPTAVLALAVGLLLPGALALFLAWLWVRVLFRDAAIGAVLHKLRARDPNPLDPEERQLANIVEEMAVAAGVRPPRLVLVDTNAANAAAVGLHFDDATIVVTRGLLDRLDRDETQAVIAHVVASVGNGDLKILATILSLFQAWGLTMLVLSTPLGPKSRRVLRRVVRAAVGGGRSDAARREAEAVADLLLRGTEMDDDDLDALLGEDTTPARVPRQLLLLLSFGAASLGGKIWVQLLATTFFGGILTQLWRARRLLADATAVQLTRNPEALGRAVAHLAELDVEPPGAEDVPYLFAVWTPALPENVRKLARTSRASLLMPMQPTPAQRFERLRALGANVDPTPYRVDPYFGHGKVAFALFVVPVGLVLLALFFGAVLVMAAVGFVSMMALVLAAWGLMRLVFAVLPGLVR